MATLRSLIKPRGIDSNKKMNHKNPSITRIQNPTENTFKNQTHTHSHLTTAAVRSLLIK